MIRISPSDPKSGRPLVASVVLALLVVTALSLIAGCGGEELRFDCVEHVHCLETEACIEGYCVDEPEVGDSCPPSHEGDEVRGLICVDGEWSEELPTLEIQEVIATPELVIRGESVELEVVVETLDEDNLEYSWSAPEGWTLADDDMASVVLMASEEFGVSATIEVEVRDVYGSSDRGEVTVTTEELFCGGSGSAEEPWDICSARFVNRVSVYEEYLGDHFALTTDVDMADLDGEEFKVIGDSDTAFEGVFDGRGHVIENLRIERDSDEVGLFGRIGTDGVVRSVVLEGADVSGAERTGLLVGRNDGQVSEVALSGVLSGDREVGGLAGRNAGSVVASRTDVVVEGDDDAVGGLVGRNIGTITNAYALGNVKGVENVGGLVGENGNIGTIRRTFSTASVEGSLEFGGLVGGNDADAAAIEDSYWVVESSGLDDSDGGVAIEERRDLAYKRNFAPSWRFYDEEDFDWVIGRDEGAMRPWLRWERACNSGGDTACGAEICDEEVQVCVPCIPDYGEGDFGGGQGSESDPWRLCTEQQLRDVAAAVADDAYASFAVFDDIRLDDEWTLDQIIGASVDNFEGHFEGHGYWIEGLDLDASGENRLGLFGTIGTQGAVHNVVLKNVRVVGAGEVGGIAGRNAGLISGSMSLADPDFCCGIVGHERVGGLVGVNEGTMIDSSVDGQVYSVSYGAVFGGLVGVNLEDGTIRGCHTSKLVSAERSEDVGGLVGVNFGEIDNSHSSSRVVGNRRVGGLVGTSNAGGAISRSHSSGDITAETSRGGGLVGENSGEIIGSHATGEVDSISTGGGLVASNVGTVTTIDTSYASGDVFCAWHCGGLVGASWSSGNIIDAYATGDVIGHPDGDGFTGAPLEAAGGLSGAIQATQIERVYSAGKVDPNGLNEVEGTVGGLIGEVWGDQFALVEVYWDTATSEENGATGEGSISGATGHSTSFFGDQGTFSEDWDFDDIWTIGVAPDGKMRPIFQWQ